MLINVRGRRPTDHGRVAINGLLRVVLTSCGYLSVCTTNSLLTGVHSPIYGNMTFGILDATTIRCDLVSRFSTRSIIFIIVIFIMHYVMTTLMLACLTVVRSIGGFCTLI